MNESSSAIRSIPRTVRYDKGTHWRAKLGFIDIPTDLVMEDNIFHLAPGGVGVSITRLKTETDTNVRSLAKHVDGMAEAASILQPGARPEVDCYARTSASIVIGEDRVNAEINRGTPYPDEINTLEAEYLENLGFDVLDIQWLNVEDG
jgi:maleate isomerase